jgi:hypothetical protein
MTRRSPELNYNKFQVSLNNKFGFITDSISKYKCGAHRRQAERLKLKRIEKEIFQVDVIATPGQIG